MRWKGRRKSTNIDDRRGRRTGGGLRLPGGLGRGMPRGGGTGGIGGIGLIVVVLIALYFGVDPTVFLGGGSGGLTPQSSEPAAPRSAEEEEMAAFVSVVLADTEDVWHRLFDQGGARYQEPTLVLFTGAVQSACGYASAAVGPFYCPGDRQVYIDLSFFGDLKNRFGAPGDFAQAYVVAHEVAHHVQTLMGISEKVHSLRQRSSERESNALSVMMELQADCFAGLWAHHADREKRILEAGDVEEALNAASAIGDDRLQKRAGGAVVPDSFTHGTSAQRVRWFQRGLDSGDVAACDTFNADRL